MGSFNSSGYKNLSDEKAHAILVRGEALVFKTAISVISSGTDIFAIANACLSIRESYKIMEQCEKIGKLKKWDCPKLQKEFENGTKFGLGVYMLYLSVLPSKILTILEWIGFKGDRDRGLQLLYEASDSDTGTFLMFCHAKCLKNKAWKPTSSKEHYVNLVCHGLSFHFSISIRRSRRSRGHWN